VATPRPAATVNQCSAARALPGCQFPCGAPILKTVLNSIGARGNMRILIPALIIAGIAMSSPSAAAEAPNPFLAESPLPLHYPPFDSIVDSHFAPAFDAGMAEQLREVDAIASNPAAPT